MKTITQKEHYLREARDFLFNYVAQGHHPLARLSTSKSKSFPTLMAHKATPIYVSIALGHTSADAVKAKAGGGGGGVVVH